MVIYQIAADDSSACGNVYTMTLLNLLKSLNL